MPGPSPVTITGFRCTGRLEAIGEGYSGDMTSGAWMMAVATVLALGSLAFLILVTVKSILDERSGERSIWREFGLGLSLMALFVVTWVAHGISEWQTFTDEQRDHGEQVEAGDFFSAFGQSTLENWQSEFLQLFSFVVLAAMFIHKGSAESKDSDEKLEASLRRIEEQLGTLPGDARSNEAERWKLPDTALKVADRALETPNELEALSRDELYELAQEREIPGRADMTREQLLRALARR